MKLTMPHGPLYEIDDERKCCNVTSCVKPCVARIGDSWWFCEAHGVILQELGYKLDPYHKED